MTHFSDNKCPKCGKESVWVEEYTDDGEIHGLSVGCDTMNCYFSEQIMFD